MKAFFSILVFLLTVLRLGEERETLVRRVANQKYKYSI